MNNTPKIEIEEIWINRHEHCPHGVIGIDWSGNAGFGRFEIVLDENGVPHAYTEHMDSGDDKAFTKAVLDALVDKIVIED